MKKIKLIIFTFILMFILTGCTNEKKEETLSKPMWLKEVTENIVSANVDAVGNIIIKEDEITDKVTYISYEYEGVTIGLIAVKDSKGDVKVVVNTCQSCGGSPYAYFVQVDDKIQCQNCGNTFAIDELDRLVDDGCNPIPIRNKTTKDGLITIKPDELKKLKNKFENWQGPKA